MVSMPAGRGLGEGQLSNRARIALRPSPLRNLAVTIVLCCPLLRPRCLRCPARRLAAGHRGPDEAHEFAGHGRHGDGRALAVAHKMTVAPVQALLGPPGVLGDRPGLAP
jgi:hypothetical protein